MTEPIDPNAPRVLGLNAVDVVLALVVASLAAALVLMDRFVVPSFARMYHEFGSESLLPPVTRSVLDHTATLGGAGAALVVATLGIFARRRGAGGVAVGLLGFAIAVALGAGVFCVYALYAPIFELADKIKP